MEKTISTKQGKITTSVRIDISLFHICKKHGIKFSDAMKEGIKLLLSEQDPFTFPYNPNLKLFQRMKLYQQKLEEELNKKIEGGGK